MNGLLIKRTTSNNPDFTTLVAHLDHELWNELKEDQANYDQYNKVPDLQTVLVLYINERAVACGCFKKYNTDTIEIKRMFVEKDYRGKGLSKIILDELEKWASEFGYKYAVLETSVHFAVAKGLYTNAGYVITDNYGQYVEMKESVCMKKELNDFSRPSEFKDLEIEYFGFEEDFIEKNIRCIPMIVRFKMDAAGVKLKLAEWTKFKVNERRELAIKDCGNDRELGIYNKYLAGLVEKYTGKEATAMEVDKHPAWADTKEVPQILTAKATEFNWSVSIEQWKSLTDLQRFALLKLCRPGHENKNFPRAMVEFGLVNSQ